MTRAIGTSEISQERLVELHPNVIQAGHALERAGLYDIALRLAEAALLMCDYLEAKNDDDVTAIKGMRLASPMVIQRIQARVGEAARE